MTSPRTPNWAPQSESAAGTMSVFSSLLAALRDCGRSRAFLQLEILALRHQLQVVERSQNRRLRLTRLDRMLWVWLSRVWWQWRSALVIVKPETVISWHRRGFRLYWGWKSRCRRGRPQVDREVRTLIRTMSTANPLWGAPRIHGELFETRRDSLASDRREIHGPAFQTTLADVAGLPGEPRAPAVAADFFVVPTATCRLLFVLVSELSRT